MMTTRLGYPNFYGPFKKFHVTLFSNHETGLVVKLLVYSQGSRAKVLKHLWLKYLYDELTKDEMKLFLACSETLRSEIKVAALRAVLIFGKKEVRRRLEQCPFLPLGEQISRTSYQGSKGLDVEISTITRNLTRVPKFSGWIRSSSSKDRKRIHKRSGDTEPLAIIENDYEDIVFDWYHYLSSSEFSILPSR
jgi:hypothetical protein